MFSFAQFIAVCWLILLDAGVWLLFGFAIAGVLHVAMPAMAIARYLKGEGLRPIVSAVLLGAPIPLCSCSVLPVAKALRDGGAGRGPTAGFLISGPETGADSITLSWALLGPVWALARPVAAILTAITAGILQPSKDVSDIPPQQAVKRENANKQEDCCDHCHGDISIDRRLTFREKVVDGIRYGLIEQPTDLARYLLPGMLVAGMITVIFPPSSLTSYGHGFPVYFAAILMGLPFYVCSTASTPLAASLLVAGVAPGPILAFLLVGPASNVTSIAAVRKLLGTAGFSIYMIVVIGVAVFCGLVLDAIQVQYGGLLAPKMLLVSNETIQVTQIVGAALLLVLLLFGLFRDVILKKR